MSKNKKPIYKRAWFWAVAVIVVAGTAGGSDTDNSKEINDEKIESTQEVSQSINENTIVENESENKVEDTVPKEYEELLKKAQFYAGSHRNRSKAEVLYQLKSLNMNRKRFSDEAIQYAIDNVEADWKEHALKRAKSYKEDMFMSKEKIYSTLTGRYIEFTAEEAQYAIDNLD